MKGFVLAIAAVALSVPVAASAQSFDGATLNYQYYFPTLSSPYAFGVNGSFVAGPGPEVVSIAGIGHSTIDIGGTNILVDFARTGSWSTSVFNGWVLSDEIDNLAPILGVSINAISNMGGFTASNLSWTADSITVNWTGLSYTSDTVLSLDVLFGQAAPAVPEPSTWAMLLLGFGALGFGMRRHRKKSRVALAY